MGTNVWQLLRERGDGQALGFGIQVVSGDWHKGSGSLEVGTPCVKTRSHSLSQLNFRPFQ